jgi:ArsR family transcriptional regulator
MTGERSPDACCEVPGIRSPQTQQVAQLAQLFKALGDPTRVTLLSLIAASPEREACICDLTEPVGLSQPTVSHHMKQLADAGLVTREQRGKWAYFRVAPQASEDLAEGLAAVLPLRWQ